MPGLTRNEFRNPDATALNNTLFQQRDASSRRANSFEMVIGKSTYRISINHNHKITVGRT